MPRKTRGKGRENSAVASSVTQDLENPAAVNPEAGKEQDEPSTVPSTEIPQPDDPAIESHFHVEESRNVLQQKRRKMQTDLTEVKPDESDQHKYVRSCLKFGKK